MKKLLGVLLCVFIPAAVVAQTLTWDPPTKRDNGEELKPGDLKEYRLYDQRKLIKVIPAPTIEAKVYPGSKENIWEVTAVDQNGLQSEFSNYVIWLPTPVPTVQWPPTEPLNLKLK